MKRRSLVALAASTALVSALLLPALAQAQAKTLKVVPHSNITILDPVWTTAFVTRNHGYMIYDTLFGTDLEGKVKPQMVDTYSASKDNKVWTFALRDGLEFHDGKPVTSEDVVASLKRWASRDSFGGVMAKSLASYETPNAKTFVIKFNQPFGVMLEALGKPSSNVPFIMPARIAATPGSEQIKENIGSGPYKFVTAEYKPGEKLVYVKNDKYKPRSEAPNGTTGGKNVYLDRVEWIIIRDPQTQFNALIAG
ncbi:MAG: ABC transporter substrate-binding protein, partial [Pseudomonadota bacterium]